MEAPKIRDHYSEPPWRFWFSGWAWTRSTTPGALPWSDPIGLSTGVASRVAHRKSNANVRIIEHALLLLFIFYLFIYYLCIIFLLLIYVYIYNLYIYIFIPLYVFIYLYYITLHYYTITVIAQRENIPSLCQRVWIFSGNIEK